MRREGHRKPKQRSVYRFLGRCLTGVRRAGQRFGRLLADAGERTAVLLGQRLRGLRIRSRTWDEDRSSVVAKLLDALPDVGERTMVPRLGRGVEVRAREPAPGQ